MILVCFNTSNSYKLKYRTNINWFALYLGKTYVHGQKTKITTKVIFYTTKIVFTEE